MEKYFWCESFYSASTKSTFLTSLISGVIFTVPSSYMMIKSDGIRRMIFSFIYEPTYFSIKCAFQFILGINMLIFLVTRQCKVQIFRLGKKCSMAWQNRQTLKFASISFLFYFDIPIVTQSRRSACQIMDMLTYEYMHRKHYPTFFLMQSGDKDALCIFPQVQT